MFKLTFQLFAGVVTYYDVAEVEPSNYIVHYTKFTNFRLTQVTQLVNEENKYISIASKNDDNHVKFSLESKQKSLVE